MNCQVGINGNMNFEMFGSIDYSLHDRSQFEAKRQDLAGLTRLHHDKK